MQENLLTKPVRQLKKGFRCGCIIMKDNDILIIQQAESYMFGLPKGKMYTDETFEQCAIREVYEETGLEVISCKIIQKGKETIFLVEEFKGELKKDSREILAIYWISINLVLNFDLNKFSKTAIKNYLSTRKQNK